MAHRPDPQLGTHYEVLGVDPAATPEEIRARYRELARTQHPDVMPGEAKTRANAQFVRILEAYRILCDPERRRHYDASLGVHAMPGTIDLDDLASAFDEIDELLIEANTHLACGRLGLAQRCCEDALAREPGNAQAEALLREIRSETARGPGHREPATRHGADATVPSGRFRVVPLATVRPLEPLRTSRGRATLFVAALVGAMAAGRWMLDTSSGPTALGLPVRSFAACGALAGLVAFALDVAALVGPFDDEMASHAPGEGRGLGITYLPLIVAAAAVHVTLALVIYVAIAAIWDRWSFSVLAVFGLACATGLAGAATAGGTWPLGLAVLGNMSFLGALTGWFIAGFFRSAAGGRL